MLEIDLKIIIVQVVTFLIGVFVLWKIAWKPLVEVLSKRKNDIAKNIADAEALKVAAEKLKKEHEQMILDVNKKADEIIQRANVHSDEYKRKTMVETEYEVKRIFDEAKKRIEDEQEKAKDDLKREIVPMAICVAEKVTERMLDEKTKKELIEKLLVDFV